MKPHTILLLGARLEFDSLEQFSDFLHLPVLAYSAIGSDSSGCGQFDMNAVAQDDREAMATTIADLHRMVAAPDDVADPWALARQQLAAIGAAVQALQQAVEAARDVQALFNASEELRAQAETLALGVEAWDSSVEPDPGDR